VRFNNSMQYPDWNKGIQEIQFVNLGKSNATEFTADVEIIRETIPDRKILSRDVVRLGGAGTTINNNLALRPESFLA